MTINRQDSADESRAHLPKSGLGRGGCKGRVPVEKETTDPATGEVQAVTTHERCRQKGCPHCGPWLRRCFAAHYIEQFENLVAEDRPDENLWFLTLTTRGELDGSLEEQLLALADRRKKYLDKLRYRAGDLSYLWVAETGEERSPHLHFLIHADLEPDELRTCWMEVGAGMVNRAKRVGDHDHLVSVVWYMSKEQFCDPERGEDGFPGLQTSGHSRDIEGYASESAKGQREQKAREALARQLANGNAEGRPVCDEKALHMYQRRALPREVGREVLIQGGGRARLLWWSGEAALVATSRGTAKVGPYEVFPAGGPLPRLYEGTEYGYFPSGLPGPEPSVEASSIPGSEATFQLDRGDAVYQWTGGDRPPWVIIEHFGNAPLRRTDREESIRKTRFHQVLLAKTQEGLENLMALASWAGDEGFYYERTIDFERMRRFSEGIVATSSCLQGLIPQIALGNPPFEGLSRQKRIEKIKGVTETYLDIFGDDFYLEAHRHGIEAEETMTQVVEVLSRAYDIDVITANDCHYSRPEDFQLQDIKTRVSMSDPGDPMYYDEEGSYAHEELHVKGAEEMINLFPEFPEAPQNTMKVLTECSGRLPLGQGEYFFPDYPGLGKAETAHERLMKECGDRFLDRYPDPTEAHKERMRYELSVIKEMGFSNYFLIVADIVEAARAKGIDVGPGRGSAAGSMVTYVLGITGLDPMAHGLLFDRFLNKERVTMPDIDIDFDDARREEVFDYIYQKYGEDRVAKIITFSRYKAKTAIKDVGKTYRFEFSELNSITKKIPEEVESEPMGDILEESEELRQMAQENERLAQTFESVDGLYKMMSHTGVHAAGAVITPDKLHRHVPTEREDGEIITQFDGDQLEDIGLLKMDILGLKTLREIRRAVEFIEDREGDFDESVLEARDDRSVYEDVFGEGDTLGIFQFESSGMQRYLDEMTPQEFEHIVAMNALYRPGPMKLIPNFIDRMHGEEEVQYLHEDVHDAVKDEVADILDDTYGIMVYQEQIMQVCRRLAGFSLGEADIMRRCVPGDTLVVDADTGERKRIDSIEPGTSVLTLNDEYELTETTVAERFENGTKPVFRVTTRSGRTIEVTEDHPLRTIEGWQHLSDLSEGDAIAVPESLPASGTESPSEERMRVLAYLIGDGHTLTNDGRVTARFYSSDPDLLEAYCDAVSALGGETTLHDHPTTDVKTVTSCGSQSRQHPIKDLVWNTGIDERAAGKRLPTEVFRYDAESLAKFVGYLFDTDGGFEETRVSYSSASEGLIDDLAHVLLRLGVTTMRFHREKENHQDNYELSIKDQRDVLKFADIVGPHLCPRRKKALDALERKVSSKSRSYSIYNLPAEITYEVKRAKYASGRTWKEGGEIVGREGRNLSSGLNFTNPNQKLSRHRTEELGRAFNSEELVNIAGGDVLWDPIVDITPVGEKKVYDLAVPPHSNFVASDIVIHNSIGKKKEKLLMEQREKFVDGCVDQGYSEILGETIFDLIEEFADYGFNRAHAAAYSAIAYQQAYLKKHHPTEFFASVIRAEDNDDDRAALIQDARRHGVSVEPPSVNTSGKKFAPIGRREAVQFGLSTIKQVGKEATSILEGRRSGGDYGSYEEFVTRAIPNKSALRNLIKAGALDGFELSRAAMFEQMDDLLKYARKLRDYRRGDRKSEPEKPEVQDQLEWPPKMRFQQERDVAGIYTSGLPTDRFPALTEAFDGRTYRHGNSDYKVRCGAIVSVDEARTSNDNPMWWIRYMTEDGITKEAMFEWRHEHAGGRIETDVPMMIVSKADVEGEWAGRFSIQNLVPMRRLPAEWTQVLHLDPDGKEAGRDLARLARGLPEGDTEVWIDVPGREGTARLEKEVQLDVETLQDIRSVREAQVF